MVKWNILIILRPPAIIVVGVDHDDAVGVVVRCARSQRNDALVRNRRVVWDAGQAVRCNRNISNSLVWSPLSELLHSGRLHNQTNKSYINGSLCSEKTPKEGNDCLNSFSDAYIILLLLRRDTKGQQIYKDRNESPFKANRSERGSEKWLREQTRNVSQPMSSKCREWKQKFVKFLIELSN